MHAVAEEIHAAWWPTRCHDHEAGPADVELPPRPPSDHDPRSRRRRRVRVVWTCGCADRLEVCPWGCASCRSKVRRWLDALPPKQPRD